MAKPQAPVRLRAHHLLCLQTYKGLGYSPQFVAGMDAIVSRLNVGAAIELVAGPDDICAGWGDDPDRHCHEPSITERDQAALAALGQHLSQRVSLGDVLDKAAELLAGWRSAFARGAPRAACKACEWHDVCTDIAATGFVEAKLQALSTSSARVFK